MVDAGLNSFRCTQPTAASPDQVAKALIVGKPWIKDETTFSDTVQLTAYFYSNGTAVLNGASPATWNYVNSTFTLTGDQGTGVTPSPNLTAGHFYFNYGGYLCHLIPLP